MGDTTWTPETARVELQQRGLPEQVLGAAERQLRVLESAPSGSTQHNEAQDRLDWLLNLPWDAPHTRAELEGVERELERVVYDQQKAKDQVLCHLVAPSPTQALYLLGARGTGKRRFAAALARGLGRPLVCAMPSLLDPERLCDPTVGPGEIARLLRRTGRSDVVLLLPDVCASEASARALQSLADMIAGASVEDAYLGVELDLSNVLVVGTGTLPLPECMMSSSNVSVVLFHDYVDEDKLEIAQRYLWPEAAARLGLARRPRMRRSTLLGLIRSYTWEMGVAELAETLDTVLRRLVLQGRRGGTLPTSLTAGRLEELLGPARYQSDRAERSAVGIVNGLYCTAYGGGLLPIEVIPLPGGGGVTVTGSVGSVGHESAEVALSWLKSRHRAYGIDIETLLRTEFHIHVADYSPKDGPSAGLAVALAMLSVATGRRVRGRVAVTGEISLRGKVGPVGGIQEKLAAAQRAGIRTVYLSRGNASEVEAMRGTIRDQLEIVLVDRIEDAAEEILV